MKSVNKLTLFRWIMGVSLALTTGMLIQFIQLAQELGVTTKSIKWTAGFALLGIAFLLALIGFLQAKALFDHFHKWLEKPWLQRLLHAKGLALFSFAGLIAAYPMIIFGPYWFYLRPILPRLFLLWVFGLLCTLWLFTAFRQPVLFMGGFTFLSFGVVFTAAVYFLGISSNPFSLGWSEASRYFYASTFFSEKLYGIPMKPTVLHPSRYMLQAIPFLLPGATILFHRAWQVGLWLVSNAIFAWALVRLLKLGSAKRSWLVGMWVFLFLFQGPIWYHLLVIPIIVLLGYRKQRFGWTLLVVIAAGLWAGISRINWIPLPGMLASMLFFLDTPVEKQPIVKYLWKPAVWSAVGGVAGLISQSLYAVWSGNDLEQFSSSLSSDLLWYRLLPNATYPLGILFGGVLVSLPVIWLAGWQMRGRWHQLHWLRWAGIISIASVFFLGGIVVSTKIGGGSNLHNLDGYLVFLAVAGVMLLFSKFTPESNSENPPKTLSNLPLSAWVLAVAIPVYLTLSTGEPVSSPTERQADRAIAVIRAEAEAVADAGKEVLFISERQLAMFGYVPSIPMVEDYEKVFLMEMAMAGNPAYLQQFYQDLANARFGLIVSQRHPVNIKSAASSFGEENNVWVERISIPLLCYYEPDLFLDEVRVQLFTPKPVVPDCPENYAEYLPGPLPTRQP